MKVHRLTRKWWRTEKYAKHMATFIGNGGCHLEEGKTTSPKVVRVVRNGRNVVGEAAAYLTSCIATVGHQSMKAFDCKGRHGSLACVGWRRSKKGKRS